MSKRIKPGDEAARPPKADERWAASGKMKSCRNLAVFPDFRRLATDQTADYRNDGGPGRGRMGGNFYHLRRLVRPPTGARSREQIKAQNEKTAPREG